MELTGGGITRFSNGGMEGIRLAEGEEQVVLRQCNQLLMKPMSDRYWLSLSHLRKTGSMLCSESACRLFKECAAISAAQLNFQSM